MSAKPARKHVTDSLPEPTPINNPFLMDGVRIKRKVNRDMTSLIHHPEMVFTCQTEAYTTDMPDKANPGTQRPVGVVDIVDRSTGQEFTLICGAVLYSSLKREEGGCKGRSYHVRMGEKVSGKNYRAVEIEEVELGG